ncbi:MAG: hypothetical protein C0179_02850 [Fervidicoccus sp.]|nr:MAG: hypothetical protein C0179_02850 [Fervidicoccus sp.]
MRRWSRVSLHTLILKLLDGVSDPATRADITATFSIITEAYVRGRLDENRLEKALTELIMDALSIKHPDKSIDELKNMSQEWVEKFRRAIRVTALRIRLGASLLREEMI